MSPRDLPLDELVDGALGGDRRAVGRLLSIVERGGAEAEQIEERTHAHSTAAHVIGITGAPGAGKSTMVARLVAAFTGASRRPAVVAVDPSSPLTGGAILGDRVRMAEVDTSAFIRSVATRGHSGGLALSVPGSARVLAAAGFDPVIIETVGVGQVEVDVTAAADTTVVVVTPGMGDAVQANKAGLLEVADIFVVNKADLPGASDTRRDLELMLELSHVTGQEDASRRPPILMVDSLAGDGIDAVRAAIDEHHDHLVTTDRLGERRRRRARYEMRSRATLAFEAHVDARLRTPEVVAAVEDVLAGRATPSSAARRVWQPDAS
ncbi:MAG: methylmalonyl Co-A mutase-associated GTPase MeaB [Acidimicrobiales bacterium]|nr:methylmalonyl Co-A mutase-associated GTPase MeaB [Acidimicrobiales bacterium]